MSDAVEIYICQPGQALKDGRIVYSNDIDGKEDAEADAKRKCQLDPSIGKIAYYRVSPSGDFRIFYSYTNPNAQEPKKKATFDDPPRKRKRKPKKKTFMQKVKSSLGLD